MTKLFQRLGYLMLCASVFAPWSVANAETEGQLMVVVGPYSGVIYAVGAEFEGADKTSFSVRAGGFSYSYTDGSYWEDGSGSILGVTGKFYSQQSMEGMYFGAGLDYISGESLFSGGNVIYSGIAPHAMIGTKIRSGSMSFEPNLYIEMIPGEQVSTVVGLGLTVGVPF